VGPLLHVGATTAYSLISCCRKAGPLLLLVATTDISLISCCRKAGPLPLLGATVMTLIQAVHEKQFFCDGLFKQKRDWNESRMTIKMFTNL
jgi:hypothetical protein